MPDAFLDELDIERRTKRWSTILSASQSETFVLESENKIVAWLSYGPCRDDDCEDSVEVWALYVCPSQWRCGYGSALMRFAENLARESRRGNIALWVLEQNLAGRHFYERLGYVPDGVKKPIEIGNLSLEELRYQRKVTPEGAPALIPSNRPSVAKQKTFGFSQQGFPRYRWK
ncbi:GNAT family N-acetyltransferase [Synoicihabitans lomoniglobus]|uniref:GNAT family N-acetyltransferase n=1 Tax=Synoicihabitans lomoniglobus TaxID=2909285 RepID=UPI002ED162E8|nr:GNAT family N-acetyltransferase [Opitutaceae bacterium LMO-M01]